MAGSRTYNDLLHSLDIDQYNTITPDTYNTQEHIRHLYESALEQGNYTILYQLEEQYKNLTKGQPMNELGYRTGKVFKLVKHLDAYDVLIKVDKTTKYPYKCIANVYDDNELTDVLEHENIAFQARVQDNRLIITCGLLNLQVTQILPEYNDSIKHSYIRTLSNYITAFRDKIYIASKEKSTTEAVEKKRKEEISDLASSYKPKTTIIMESESVSLDVPDDLTMQDKFTTIVGSMNEIVDSINNSTELGSQKELVEAFTNARAGINKYSHTEPSKVSGFVSKYLGKSKWLSKKAEGVKATAAENQSVKKNIDVIFGLMHEKYNRLVEVAEGLQKSRATLEAQITSLQDLEKESDSYLSTFKDQADIPTSELSLNTQIKASIQKYKDRIVKVKGAITAMQATIIALGRDLPAHKSDLEDEMALSGLLSNIDDYQKMFGEIKDLVIDVTDSTRAKTFEVVDNLMKMQIEDTHTMEAIAKNIDSGKNFAKMLSTNSKQLADKTVRDAKFIQEVASGTAIEDARKHIKKITT